MLVGDLLDSLDARFPFAAAAAWDPIGLQVGDPSRPVGTVAVCHEVTESVVDALVELDASTIVAYHPLLFEPTTAFVAGRTPPGRALRLAVHGMSLVVVHTALDAAKPGTGDFALRAMGLSTNEILTTAEDETPIGRVARLETALTTAALSDLVSRTFGVRCLVADAGRPIRSVAVVPGSGGSFIDAATDVVDALITGDVTHHRARSAIDRGLSIIDPGHAATERPGVVELYAAVSDSVEDVAMIDDDPSPWKD